VIFAEANIQREPAHNTPATIFYSNAVGVPVCVFAAWTLACHICVIFHVSFAALARIGPAAMGIGLVLGVCAARLGSMLGPKQRNDTPSIDRITWKWMVAPILLVAARAAGLGYQAFWILCVLFLGSLLIRSRGTPEQTGQQHSSLIEQVSPVTLGILVFFAVLSASLTFIAHRPDADDATYVGIASDAVAHPDLAVLSHDVLYGNDRLPLILPTYSVDSYELLGAVLSRWFGGAPIWWLHALLPAVMGAFLPFAWAELMGAFAPRRWLLATGLALIFLLLLGESHYSLGNFAFVRLFQGKAILASIGVPLLFSWAWKIQDRWSWWNWMLLFSGTVACVGLSAIALFVVPISLGIASLGGISQKRISRSVMVLAPVVYPLAWGLVLRSRFHAVAHTFEIAHQNAPGTVAQVFGTHGQYLIWLGFLFVPLVAPGSHRRRLAAYGLLYFLIPVDPFLVKTIARLATSVSAWRVLWCVPVVGFVAAWLVWTFEAGATKWGRKGALAAGVLILASIAYLVPNSTLRPSNGVTLSLQPLKVPPQEYAAAQAAVESSESTVLAPEPVAAWIPTFVHRPQLVSVRANYDDEMAIHMTTDEATTRRELREMVSGTQFPPRRTEELLDSLQKYSVGLIVADRTIADRLEPHLITHGYLRTKTVENYVIFAYPSH